MSSLLLGLIRHFNVTVFARENESVEEIDISSLHLNIESIPAAEASDRRQRGNSWSLACSYTQAAHTHTHIHTIRTVCSSLLLDQ